MSDTKLPEVVAAGDAAALVVLGEEISPPVNARVQALARALESRALPGVAEVTIAYASLLVHYDPLAVSFAQVKAAVLATAGQTPVEAGREGPLREIPTLYGGAYGIDLPFLAQRLGLSEEEVVHLHSSATYLVYMLGFAPGHPYLGGLPSALAMPRLETPRPLVPAGTVAIANQTVIYPLDSPGGWRWLGRTPLKMFDPRADPPTYLQAGDRVRFLPITEEEYLARGGTKATGGRGDAGKGQPSPREPSSERFTPLPRGEGTSYPPLPWGEGRGEGRPPSPVATLPRTGSGERRPLSIEVVASGFLTTVQDLGRMGYQKLGIPTAGAMDPLALRAANALVGNDPGAAALEITLAGSTLRFDEACVVALAGGDLSPRLDGRPLEGWRSYLVRRGSTLEFAGRRSGARAYLAVSGGVAVEPWLGSRSTYLMAGVGGYQGRALRVGDRLPVGRAAVPLAAVAGAGIPPERRPPYSPQPILRVILGPHLDRFTEEGVNSFLSGSYRVGVASNRMGYRLEGPRIAHTRGPDIVSCGIPLGGLQVPGDGQPILLMADHQTTGGYTMVACVIQADIPLAAQCLPGERLKFRAVELEEAREALRQQRQALLTTIEEEEIAPWQR